LSLVVVSKLVLHHCFLSWCRMVLETNIGAGTPQWTLPWTTLFVASIRHNFRRSDDWIISVNCYGENCFTVLCDILRCCLQAYNPFLKWEGNITRLNKYWWIWICVWRL
jgi:hypothetical protein